MGNGMGRQDRVLSRFFSPSHSRGVLILFKPRLDVNLEKTTADKHGRCVVTKCTIDGSNTTFVNIYAPNVASQQVAFLRELTTLMIP